MQNDPSRLSQKNDTLAKFGQNGAIFLAQGTIKDALILYPKTPAIQLADILMREADREVAAALSQILTQKFYVHGILSERRKEARENRKEELLPGFEHLPLRIPTEKGTRIRLMNANYRALRHYFRILMAKQRERRKEDPKLNELRELMEKVRKRARTEERITVKEVLAWD